MPGPIGLVFKGVSAGIGLATEANAHRKEKKAAQQQAQQDASREGGPAPPEYGEASSSSTPNYQGAYSDDKKIQVEDDSDSDDELDGDHADWALDDAVAAVESNDAPPPSYDQALEDPRSVDDVMESFKSEHASAMEVHHKEEVPLPCPVVLPQRRPNDKRRGFVRAYAPILGECKGIDQDTFMAFLKDFDKSSKASPVFDVFNVAAGVVGLVPGPITMGVSIGVQIISRTGQAIQGLYRTNVYLNTINEEFFMPHGLYCMIMTFKPDKPGQQYVTIDINESTTQNITKALSQPESKTRSTLKNLRGSSGVSKGNLSLPESAPLIYPALDKAALDGQQLSPQKQAKLKSSQKFIADYMDRRSQATYYAQNPHNKLASAPEKQFASRFADPNHPMYHGGLIGFLSGGTIDRSDHFANRRLRRAERRAWRRGIRLTDNDREAIRGGKSIKTGLLKRVMTRNVLYLMICNLPTEQEMEQARQQIQAAKVSKKGTPNPYDSRSGSYGSHASQ